MRLALEHFNSLISLVNHFNNDKRCRDFITEQRWGKVVVCLERYIDEAVFRFNTKEMKEADRFSIMFEKSIGKVLYEDVKMAA